jgi:ketosteroid isomerase-like protein
MKNNKFVLKSPNEVESLYYEAFRRSDFEVMTRLWANDGVVVIHPGSTAIVGFDAVMANWQILFQQAQASEINVNVIHQTQSDSLAVHLVEEELIMAGELVGMVLATNVYQKFENGWLMTQHHGSLVQEQLKPNTLQ